MRHFCRQVMVSFFVDISVKAVVDRDDKHVAVNSKADRNASVAGQGVVCCGIGIFQKIAEDRAELWLTQRERGRKLDADRKIDRH